MNYLLNITRDESSFKVVAENVMTLQQVLYSFGYSTLTTEQLDVLSSGGHITGYDWPDTDAYNATEVHIEVKRGDFIVAQEVK